MQSRKGKEFIFPDNVESGYNLIKGVTVKAFFTVFLPFFIVGVLILFIPPYNLVFFMVKLFIAFLISTIGLAITISRPVKYRRNITVVQHFKFLKQFNKRQKLFYISGKKEGDL